MARFCLGSTGGSTVSESGKGCFLDKSCTSVLFAQISDHFDRESNHNFKYYLFIKDFKSTAFFWLLKSNKTRNQIPPSTLDTQFQNFMPSDTLFVQCDTFDSADSNFRIRFFRKEGQIEEFSRTQKSRLYESYNYGRSAKFKTSTNQDWKYCEFTSNQTIIVTDKVPAKQVKYFLAPISDNDIITNLAVFNHELSSYTIDLTVGPKNPFGVGFDLNKIRNTSHLNPNDNEEIPSTTNLPTKKQKRQRKKSPQLGESPSSVEF